MCMSPLLQQQPETEGDLRLGELDITTSTLSLAGIENQIEQFADHDVLKAILDQGCDAKEYGRQYEGKLRQAELESIQDYITESDNLAVLHEQVCCFWLTASALREGAVALTCVGKPAFPVAQAQRMSVATAKADVCRSAEVLDMVEPICAVPADQQLRPHLGDHGGHVGQIPGGPWEHQHRDSSPAGAVPEHEREAQESQGHGAEAGAVHRQHCHSR